MTANSAVLELRGRLFGMHPLVWTDLVPRCGCLCNGSVLSCRPRATRGLEWRRVFSVARTQFVSTFALVRAAAQPQVIDLSFSRCCARPSGTIAFKHDALYLISLTCTISFLTPATII
jgi:hypothetical protein